MLGFERVVIMGNLGRDPEMRYTPNGTPVTNFSVAVNKEYTDKDGVYDLVKAFKIIAEDMEQLYNEIEKAYREDAEWCSYGWSADQLALYPTQKKIYNKLKKFKDPHHMIAVERVLMVDI